MEILPLTSARFPDFEALFGPTGACMGCWCMWWRKTRAAASRDSGEGNRRDMEALVASGAVPGLLAYEDGVPVGWVSVGPRADYGALARSRVLAPLDESPVWSVVCFYVRKDRRRRGLTRALLAAAVRFAAAQGATMLEAYPAAAPADGRRRADWENFMGFEGLYASAGFSVAARPSPARLVMRRPIRPEDADA